MADRRSSPALTLFAFAVVSVVLWRIASGGRRAPVPVPAPPAHHPRSSAVPADAINPPISPAPAPAPAPAPTPTADSTGPAADAPAESAGMNVPGGYFDQLERAQTRRQLRASAGVTYLNDVVAESRDSALHRWNNRIRDPVRVYLPRDTVENFRPAFLDAVRAAFTRWDAVGLPVRFAFVDNSTEADVVFHWRRQFDIDRTGQTDLTWDGDGHVQSAVVTIATFDPKGHAMGVDDVRIVALHEIGHLLGLNHSSDSADVMFGHTVAHDLSLRDEASARLLYQLPPGSVK